MALPDSLCGLLDAAAYPHPCARIELFETHISWVLLTGDYAYKIKKAVRFSFLDFSTLERREHFCREELRCNRSFAPALYRDVVPISQRADGSLCVDGSNDDANLLEWAVQMQQFDPQAQLDCMLEHDAVTPAMLGAFGRDLAALHAALPRMTDAATEVEQRVFKPVQDNFTEIAATGLRTSHADKLHKVESLSLRLGEQLRDRIIKRMQQGYLRECHGDLHLSNLVLLDGKVTAFDCLEFSPELRWIDTISDVAFLFMDCAERCRDDLAYAFLDQYLDASGDYRGVGVLNYYAVYRSMVRAKVAALRWAQEPDEASANRFARHLGWAHDRLERPPGTLLLMCGLSASGKSYVAERLAPLLPAIRLRSDVARKALAGLATMAQTKSDVDAGLYTKERSDEVFAFLQQQAGTLLQAGENVIIDATFIKRKRRADFLALAKQLDVNARIIYCNAPIEVLRERISKRAATGSDPSEATLDVLEAQRKVFTPPGPDEAVIELATDKPLGDAELRALNAAV